MSKLLDFFSKRKKTAATGAVVLGLLGTSVGAGVIVSGTPVVVGSDTANIWVDSNGGTCVDNASLTAYVDADACSTFDAANDTCDNGDIVRIKDGSTYSGQSLSGSNSRGSACLFKPETDGDSIAVDGEIDMASTTAWITMTSIHQTIDTDDYLNILDVFGDNLTFNDHTATRFQISTGANTVLVDDSDFGPCIASYGTGGPGVNGNNFGVCNNRITGTATSITISDSDLHGNLQTWDGVSGPNGQPPHSECLAIFGGITINIHRNKLWDCGDSANTLIQADGGGQEATNLSLVGNWFNVAWNATDGTATNEKCTGVDLRVADIAGSFDFSWNTLNRCTSTGGLEIPWVSTNSGDGARYASSLTSARFIGNIGTTVAGGGGGGCPTNSGSNTIDYNVQQRWQDGNPGYLVCGSNATLISGVNTFLTDTTKHGDFDFHLTGSVQAWEDAVPTSVSGGCPVDIDGTARPVGSNCDPGSDER
jgi:hypothetical protein